MRACPSLCHQAVSLVLLRIVGAGRGALLPVLLRRTFLRYVLLVVAVPLQLCRVVCHPQTASRRVHDDRHPPAARDGSPIRAAGEERDVLDAEPDVGQAQAALDICLDLLFEGTGRPIPLDHVRRR